ncbi:MAG TPA: type II toxin-antitoxin system HicB family antitoxin [Burkholderiaceae bacterium]
MTGNEFIRKLKALGKLRGISVSLNASRGKGSHQTLYFGSRTEIRHAAWHVLAAWYPGFGPLKEYKVERFEYAVRLKPADEGGFVVSCRDLPQLVTQGDDLAQALVEAADAMDEVFAAYMQGGLPMPAPSRPRKGERLVSPPAETVAKAALHVAMSEAGFTKVQLAKRLGVDEKEVRRMLDPHYGSKLPRIAEAIGVLGRRLVIGLEAA